MKIAKTISRNSRSANGRATVYISKTGQFAISKKATQEFMLNENNYKDYGFLFHVNLMGDLYIERVLIHKHGDAFLINRSKSGGFRFYSKQALMVIPGQALDFGYEKSVTMEIDFSAGVTLDGRLMYPIRQIKLPIS